MKQLLFVVLALGLATSAFADDGSPEGLDAQRSWPQELTGPLFGVPTPESAAANGAAQGRSASAGDRPHTVGLGGKAGGFAFGVGASARAWATDRIGVQTDLSHFEVGTVSVTQISPSVIVTLGSPDLDADTQLRPYAGGGINIMRVASTFSSDSGVGFQAFVGGEWVFARAPRLGLSGDIGYYSTGKFFNVSIGGFAVSVLGHYYIK